MPDRKTELLYTPSTDASSVSPQDAPEAPEPSGDLLPGQDAPEGSPGAANGKALPGEEADRKETRKVASYAMKLERRAREAERASKARIQKAEAVERAIAASQQDPTALLRAAGLDPTAYFQQLIDYNINQGAAPDPVQDRLTAAEKQLADYQAASAAKLAQLEQLQIDNDIRVVIARDVLPMLKAEPEAFDLLLLEHKGDESAAARTVYQNVEDIYRQTGNILPFKEVANELEQLLQEQHDQYLEQLTRSNRYKSKLGGSPTNPAAADSNTPKALPAANKQKPNTLTNNQNPSIYQSDSRGITAMSHEERKAQILKKHGA